VGQKQPMNVLQGEQYCDVWEGRTKTNYMYTTPVDKSMPD